MTCTIIGVTGSEKNRRMGRPSKGVRAEVKLRVPVPLKEAAQEAAREQGLTENDFYMALAAKYVGLQQLAPRLPARRARKPRVDDAQEELQLQDIA